MANHCGEKRTRLSGRFLVVVFLAFLTLAASGCGSGDTNYLISGTITSGGTALAGVTVTLSGQATGTTTTDANGNYSFGSLSSGTYGLTPSLAGYIFVPLSRPAYLYGFNAVGFNFSASRGLSGSATAHTLYRHSDGTVRAWGRNNKGQLGNGTIGDSAAHVTVTGLADITKVAAGNEHSLALKSDGTVWAWGSNSKGQLGDGFTVDQLTPVQVMMSPSIGLTGVTAIAAGVDFSLALKSDGTVWAWGYNSSSQLGNGLTTDSPIPVQVTGLTGVTAISAGFDHSVALGIDGLVRAWGNNSQGQLGNNTTTASTTFVQVGVVSAVLAVSAGNQFTVVARGNGLSSTVWTWGDNTYGQLGNGTTADSWTPIQVIGGLSYLTAVAAGSDHALALKNDGTVWAWGNNTNGQLGNGTTSVSYTPVQTTTPPLAVQGIIAGYQDSFAATTIGTIWAWGDNAYGQLGNGVGPDQLIPENITSTLP